MIKKILIGLVLIIGIFLAIVALQPADYKITRSATLAAPPDVVFAQVNDFHKWETWSPWAKMDPNVKNSFEGAPAGVGSIFAWSGNDKVGQGKMTITESHPDDLIRLKLDFIKPMESSCITEFTFKPVGDQTAVNWTMSGKNGFVGKAFCLFMNMDKMVGGDFEKGLAQMNVAVQNATKK